MVRRNIKDIVIIIIACILANVFSQLMGAVNLDIAKMVLFFLSIVFSLIALAVSIRFVLKVFSQGKVLTSDSDKLKFKNKIIISVFVITFVLVIIVFCLFYFLYI